MTRSTARTPGTVLPTRFACLMAAVALLLGSADAHETQQIDGGYRLTVGYVTEPPYTEERNGLSLAVATSEDEPVTNLQDALEATLVAPGGERRTLELRGAHGDPGHYTDDVVLTEPGVYRLELGGFVRDVEVDASFELHEVRPLEALRFP